LETTSQRFWEGHGFSRAFVYSLKRSRSCPEFVQETSAWVIVSELLAEQLLAGFAFTTRVPRQEDHGIDFFCNLISRHEKAPC
jgi:hypothetical protein